jgi:ribosomal protein S25
VFSAIETLNKSHGPVHPVAIRDEVKQWGIDYDDIELAIDRLLSKGLIGRDEYGTVWSKKWDAEVSANEELVYNKIKEYTSKTFGGGVTFDELAREMEPIGINRNALDWIAKKLLDQRKIRSLYTPSKGAVLSVPPEPDMFNYREAPDYALEELKVMFRNMARDQRHKEDYEKYMDEVRKIEEELARRKEEGEAYKRSILEKARADTLTYETTPDTNPFHWGNEPEYCMEVDPYVSAKERTKIVAEVMEDLGEKPDREKIFREYVEWFKKRRSVKSTDELDKHKDPYERYLEKNAKAYRMVESVRNAVEKNIWAWGDISVERLADELNTDVGTAKLALKHLFLNSYEKPPYVIKDGKTGRVKSPEEGIERYDIIARPEGWEYLHDYDPKGRWRSDTRGLRALENLDFPLEYGKGEGVLEINALGKAKVEILNYDRTALFRGEVDLSDLKLEPGRYVLQFGDGDKSAVTSPHTIVREKGKDGDIVLTFKRFDMESKGEKITREKRLYVKPTDKKPEEYPNIKTSLTAQISLASKDLKKLLKDLDRAEIVELAVEDGRSVVRLKDKWGEEDRVVTGEVLHSTSGNEKVKCSARNLKALVDSLNPGDRVTIHLPDKPDLPLKIVVDTEHISGEYWIAPYVGDNY